jgi:hypothetical protein
MPHGRRTIVASIFRRRTTMQRRLPKQLPMPFEREVPAVVLPTRIAQDLVKALADLLLAAVLGTNDEERDDAREDHR